MANDAIEYIREAWDTLLNGKKNKQKKNAALGEIDAILNEQPAGDKPTERPTLPDAPKYERAEYTPPTDEEVTRRAESELAAYKSQGEKEVEKEIAALAEKYAVDQKTTTENHEAALDKTQASYADAKRSTSADMLKRGLSRSSIAANKIAALDAGEAAAKAQLAAAYAQKSDEIAGQINALDVKRQEALNDFNISYAAKLTERIEALKSERAELTDKALRYNNSLAEKEYAAAVDKAMKESDLYTEQLTQQQKQQQLAQTTDDSREIYTAVAAKLRTLNKNDAREIVLTHKDLRARVGDELYYRLYDEFCR